MTKPRLILEEFLPFQLSVLSNRISQEIASIYQQQYDLKLNEWRVMAILGDSPNISAKQVADRGIMDKVTVSRAVKKLIEKNYIERAISQQDRRQSELRLTAAGSKIYQAIVPLVLAKEREITSRYTELANIIKSLELETPPISHTGR